MAEIPYRNRVLFYDSEEARAIRSAVLTPQRIAEINARDAAGKQYMRDLPKRQRDRERGWWHGECFHMAREDRNSKAQQSIDQMQAELTSYREREFATSIPKPRFRAGQSVLQWWAPWMKKADALPQNYNKKNRPAWFSAEICSYETYGSLKYAGKITVGNIYNVY